MDRGALQQFLTRTELCGGLPEEVIGALARGVRLRELQNGEVLITQGEPGVSLFIVLEGRLEARRSAVVPAGAGGQLVLGHVGRGGVVGEMAVLSDEPRLCSVVAVRETRVLELSRADFLAIVAQHPAALFRVTQQIIRRVHRGAEDPPVTTVALIPQGPGVDARRLADGLVAALSPFGRSALLRPGALDAAASGEQLMEQLAQLEQRHDLVIYQGTHEDTPWTRLAIRQADLVLLIANAGDDPALSRLEREALFGERPLSAARLDLVLLHPAGSGAPRGSLRWLAPRKVHLHHHLRLGDEADLARLGRLVTGNAIQLVLSGGGARGFAHIGVLRALREAGVPVDLVGGTSMGAIMGAGVAMEWSTEEILDAVGRFAGSLKDLTLPMLSLFSAGRMTRALQGICQERQIEDLRLGFFAVSTDLNRAEEFVHRRGPLWLALRASTASPGIVPPVLWEDRCLVDGGVFNNLPIDVMAHSTPGHAIAINVSQQPALELTLREPSISGWRLLWRRVNPLRSSQTGRRAPDPHIADVIACAVTLADERARRARQAQTPVAVTVTPPVSRYHTLDFESAGVIVEEGYRHAREHIAEWKRALPGGHPAPIAPSPGEYR